MFDVVLKIRVIIMMMFQKQILNKEQNLQENATL